MDLGSIPGEGINSAVHWMNMTPEERQMLRESLELSRKNNEIISKMYRASLWGRGIKILYWVILIGVTVGSFLFLQPYIDTLKDVYGGFSQSQEQVKSFFNL